MNLLGQITLYDHIILCFDLLEFLRFDCQILSNWRGVRDNLLIQLSIQIGEK